MTCYMAGRKFREGAPEAVMRCCDAGERFKKERYTVIIHYRVEHPLRSCRDRYDFLVIPEEGEPYLRKMRSTLGVIFGKTVPWLEVPQRVRDCTEKYLAEVRR